MSNFKTRSAVAMDIYVHAGVGINLRLSASWQHRLVHGGRGHRTVLCGRVQTSENAKAWQVYSALIKLLV